MPLLCSSHAGTQAAVIPAVQLPRVHKHTVPLRFHMHTAAACCWRCCCPCCVCPGNVLLVARLDWLAAGTSCLICPQPWSAT